MPVEWISKDKCKKMIQPGVYGRLATSGKDNVPYITPINYVYINDCIYVHTGFKGRKIQNITDNPKVCFEISSSGNLYGKEKACSFTMRYWSILIQGNASMINDTAVKKEILQAFMKKYASRVDHEPVTEEEAKSVNIIQITIDDISGKLSVDPQDN